MNDKFNKLLGLLNKKINDKKNERDDLIKRIEACSSSICELGDKIQSLEMNSKTIKDELKKYKRYPLYVLRFITVSFLSIIFELIVLFMYFVYNYSMITLGVVSGLYKTILCIGLFAVTTVFAVLITKTFYQACKEEKLNVKTIRKIRKKYKSKDEIQKRLQLINEKLKELVEELNNAKDQKYELEVNLEDISLEIKELEEKLGISKEAYLDALETVQETSTEEKLNARYEESGIEEKVQSLDKKSVGKKFVVTKKEN